MEIPGVYTILNLTLKLFNNIPWYTFYYYILYVLFSGTGETKNASDNIIWCPVRSK